MCAAKACTGLEVAAQTDSRHLPDGAPTNIATILLRDGLAEVDSGINEQELTDAQAFAKVRKLGIWDR